MLPSYDLFAFLTAATLVAVMPGPGLLFLGARTLSAGRTTGLLSCIGSVLGGSVHVAAGAIGLSALLMASATAFSVLKTLGGLYLVWLAWRTWRDAGRRPSLTLAPLRQGNPIVQGFIVEVTNPKTALFFLAFIPQFIERASGNVGLQFATLGALAILLNTTTALVVIFSASHLRSRVALEGKFLERLQKGSSVILAVLGMLTLFARRPQS